MATSASPSKGDFKLPMPPPLVHTRIAHDERPSTPQQMGFVSPTHTPAGSPSKKKAPPGAHDLPDAFENAMRLAPTGGNPSRSTLQNFKDAPGSPTKERLPLTSDVSNDFRASVIQDKRFAPGSPTKVGKENTPPVSQANYNSAAASRSEIYKKEQGSAKAVPRGLTPDVLEKLQKPSVKRLANVTQLCMLSSNQLKHGTIANQTKTSWTTTLISSATSTIARQDRINLMRKCRAQTRNTKHH